MLRGKKVIMLMLIVTILLISGCSDTIVKEDTKPQIKKEELNIIKENINTTASKVAEKEIGTPPIKKDIEKCNKSLGASPLAIKDLSFIEPQGAVSDSHVIPVDHQYWHLEGKNNQNFKLISPAPGYITHVGKFNNPGGNNNDYRLVIEHPCGLSTIFIHIDVLESKILSGIKFRKSGGYLFASTKIPVKEGEMLGKISGGSFDFSLHDKNVTLKGFVYPKHYETESWKIHTVDPFDYFEEPIKSQLIKKVIRTAPPLGGKIDYDVKGRLVGNWFKKDTNWYRGNQLSSYWKGHLSIVYDHYDPTQIRISIGDYQGKPKQFGVKGNTPNPKDVKNIVKYELVDYDYYIGNNHWDRTTVSKEVKAKNSDQVQGTMLFQLLEDGKLKIEIFPDKKTEEVDGFKNNPKIYER